MNSPVENRSEHAREKVADPRITLVIAVYQRLDFLERIFVSLGNQSFDDFEVIIADDGSGPELREFVQQNQSRFRYPLRHVWHPDDGFKKTIIVNQAMTLARAAYLVFIDGDCVLHHRFLERHFARRKKKQALSGRRVMLRQERTETLTLDDIRSRRIEQIGFWWSGCNENTRQNGFYLPAAFAFKNRFRKRYSILGCNFSLYKGDFLAVNGYDERIIGRGLEDNNLSTRLINDGVEIKSIANEALQYHCFHTVDPMPHSEEFVKTFRDSDETRTRFGIAGSQESGAEPG